MVAKKNDFAAFEKVDQEDWWSVLSWLDSIKKDVPTKQSALLLGDLAKHKSPHVRFAAMQLLLQWVEESVVQEVGEEIASSASSRLLREEREEVKMLASHILMFIPEHATPLLVSLYVRAEQERDIDEAKICQLFGQLPTKFAPFVVELLSGDSFEQRGKYLLYQGLWGLGEEGKQALSFLLRRIKEESQKEYLGESRYLVQILARVCGSDVMPLCEVLALDLSELNALCVDELVKKGKSARPALPCVLRLIEAGRDEHPSFLGKVLELLLVLGEDAREALQPLFRRLDEWPEKEYAYANVQELCGKAFLFFARIGTQEAKKILWESLDSHIYRVFVLKVLPEVRSLSVEEYERWVQGLVQLLGQGDLDGWERHLVVKTLESWGERAVSALPVLLRVMGEASDGLLRSCLAAVRAMGKEASKQAVERVRALLGLQKGATETLLDFLKYALDEEEQTALSEETPKDDAKDTWSDEKSLEEGFESTNSEPEEEKGLILPFQSSQVRFEVRSMTLDLLLSRIKHQELVLQPEFQRGDVWSRVQKSRLIESLLLRIPLPSFYIDGSDVERWQVIDGQQRLTAIRAFLLDDVAESLRLEGLEFFASYEGCHRGQIPHHLLRRLLETQVTLFVVEAKMERALMFNIFKRINTGGTPLSAQEIRHALYQGHATKLLKELATSDSFRKVFGGKISDQRMEGRELVLRGMLFFLRAPEKWFVFRDEDRLNQAMEDLNGLSDEEIESLSSSMLRAYETFSSLFGGDLLRSSQFFPHTVPFLPSFLRGGRQLPSLFLRCFEVWMAHLASSHAQETKALLKKREGILEEWHKLLEEDWKARFSRKRQAEQAKYLFYAVRSLLDKALDEG